MYKKVTNYFWLSISVYRCHAIKYSCPKKLVLKSFLETFWRFRSLCTAALSQLLPRLPARPLVLPAGRRTSHAGKPVFWPWCLSTCFPHTVAEHSAALTILMGLWRRQWWRRRRPLKAKRSLSIRKPAGVAWQHALLYNSRKLATVAPPLAAHAARPTAATAIWPSLARPLGYWEPSCSYATMQPHWPLLRAYALLRLWVKAAFSSINFSWLVY